MPAPSCPRIVENSFFGIGTRKRVGVGVANAGGLDLDQHFAGMQPLQIDRLDRERRTCFVRNGGACFHDLPPCGDCKIDSALFDKLSLRLSQDVPPSMQLAFHSIDLTISSHIFLASPNSIIVLSR